MCRKKKEQPLSSIVHNCDTCKYAKYYSLENAICTMSLRGKQVKYYNGCRKWKYREPRGGGIRI